MGLVTFQRMRARAAVAAKNNAEDDVAEDDKKDVPEEKEQSKPKATIARRGGK